MRGSTPQETNRSPRPPARLLGPRAAIAGLLLAGLAAGCGGGETTVTVTVGGDAQAEAEAASEIAGHVDASDVVRAFPPAIVLDGDIAAEKKGTPERALLEWWQAFQFDDLEAVKDLTSQATIDAIGEDKLAQLVQLPGPGLGGVEILDASESGDTAAVEAGLLTFTPENPGEPPPREPTNSLPATFAMTKENGDWKFAETAFLEPKLEALAN